MMSIQTKLTIEGEKGFHGFAPPACISRGFERGHGSSNGLGNQ